MTQVVEPAKEEETARLEIAGAAALMAHGEFHPDPVHKQAYDDLAKKNGGPRFSLRPALSELIM